MRTALSAKWLPEAAESCATLILPSDADTILDHYQGQLVDLLRHELDGEIAAGLVIARTKRYVALRPWRKSAAPRHSNVTLIVVNSVTTGIEESLGARGAQAGGLFFFYATRNQLMPVLHQMQVSGNCYKVRLAARQLGVGLTLKDYGLLDGTTRKADFLSKNPNGRVPLLELEDGRTLAESDAILWYLSEGTPLLPAARWGRAEVLQWMFFEQYSHEPYIAVARFWLAFASKEELEKRRHLVPEWHAKGNAALGVMQAHLARHDWFAGGRYSIADIALYAYTHCAADGGFDLTAFPAVGAWLERVAGEPRHVPLDVTW